MKKRYRKNYHKEYREKRIAAGVCIMCAINPPKETSKSCDACTMKMVNNRKKLAKERLGKGYCSVCLIRQPKEGRKLCIKCIKLKTLTPEKKLRAKCLRYGIDENDYVRMNEKQNGLCAICKRPPDGKWKMLNIDHCHKANIVRGLLCCNCNLGIGNLRDDINILYEAIRYLKSQ